MEGGERTVVDAVMHSRHMSKPVVAVTLKRALGRHPLRQDLSLRGATDVSAGPAFGSLPVSDLLNQNSSSFGVWDIAISF